MFHLLTCFKNELWTDNIFYEKFHSMFDLLQNNNTLDLEGNYRSSLPMTRNLDIKRKGKDSFER